MNTAFLALCLAWPLMFAPGPTETTAPHSDNLSVRSSDIGSVCYTDGLSEVFFTENRGQWNNAVKFRAQVGGVTVWFCDDGVYHELVEVVGSDLSGLTTASADRPEERCIRPETIKRRVICVSYVESNKLPRITGERQLGHSCNFFRGRNPSDWYTNVSNFESIVYHDIYDCIDLTFYSSNGQLEYDFVVSQGADISQIRVAYSGVESLEVDSCGDVVVSTAWGSVVERSPIVYQMNSDQKEHLNGQFVLLERDTFGFKIDDLPNRFYTTIIDPVIVYSTYMGGSEGDIAKGIVADSSGNVFVTGWTLSPDFPTINPIQSDNLGSYDVFISKLTGSGELVFSSYLGGTDYDKSFAIAVDAEGNAAVCGKTYSSDFPTANPIQSEFTSNHFTTFVSKISGTGDALMFSTYLGGTNHEEGEGIAVDCDGNWYIAGNTGSIDFPTVNPYQLDQPSTDVFLTKLTGDGSTILYSTYLGGTFDEYARAIAVDDSNCAYVTGKVSSLDFPTVSAFQPNFAGIYNDGFVTKFSSDGGSLVYSTYLGGGASDDQGYGIAVDKCFRATITGYTWSHDFPTKNAIQPNIGGETDAFVVKLSIAGDSLISGTYLGGSDQDFGWGIDTDKRCNTIVIGTTSSVDFPLHEPLQLDQGEDDAFVTKIDSTGAGLIFSTYLGGSSYEEGYGICVDGNDDVFITGVTAGHNFPLKTPFQDSVAGAYDLFVAKFHDCVDADTDWMCDSTDNCLDVYNPLQTDSDGDGAGDSCDICPYDPENDIDSDGVCGDVDNCPDSLNIDQLDSDEDGVGDVCDVCPHHVADDCCNPVGANTRPSITSEVLIETFPGDLVLYVAAASDGDCDGSELALSFTDNPHWLVTWRDTIHGNVECTYTDTSFSVIASDGDLADTIEVSITIDKSNQAPAITDTLSRVYVQSQMQFSYNPTFTDPDDIDHTVSYLSYPHWCAVADDTVSGTAPDTLFVELLTAVVADYCQADTFSFIVSVYFCGDLNGSGEIDIDDVVYLIGYIFGSGSEPEPLESADANCSGAIDIDDVVYLITYIFGGGQSPCDLTGDGDADC